MRDVIIIILLLFIAATNLIIIGNTNNIQDKMFEKIFNKCSVHYQDNEDRED